MCIDKRAEATTLAQTKSVGAFIGLRALVTGTHSSNWCSALALVCLNWRAELSRVVHLQVLSSLWLDPTITRFVCVSCTRVAKVDMC